jgi:hypothetical protein
MDRDYKKLLAKLDRPPSGHNWARFVHGDDVVRTTKAIMSFVKGIPPLTYLPGSSAIKDRIQLGINVETAIQMTRRSGSPAGRKQNEALVKAFFEYDDERQYPNHSYIEFEREWFRVSRDVSVPVSPLSILIEKGQFVPVFVCGWSEVKLTDFQRRLLVSVYEDAFLSLTDFQHSPAEFLFFPKSGDAGKSDRTSEVWRRGDYDLLSEKELNSAVEVFLTAREAARQILLREMADAERRSGETAPVSSSLSLGDLFDSLKK